MAQDGLMSGQVCMITGATSGIGLATARALARMDAHLVMVGRNPKKGADTVASIRQESGNDGVEFLLADLSVQAQVRRLAAEFQERHSRLDVLLNNAGGFYLRRKLSADGIEMTWALNLLSPFLLTNLLLDTLKASAPARIISVSSGMHNSAHLDFEDLEGERKYSGTGAYGQSKLALVLFTYELARRLEGTGVTVNALHPGFVATGIGQDGVPILKLVSPLLRLIAMSPEEGAETSIYLASSPEVKGVTGRYFVEKQSAQSSQASYDQAAAQRLWEVCVRMTGL